MNKFLIIDWNSCNNQFVNNGQSSEPSSCFLLSASQRQFSLTGPAQKGSTTRKAWVLKNSTAVGLSLIPPL